MLATRLDLSPRNITGLVDALESGGYVTRSPHPSDRRAVIVSLTASARPFMAEMQREHAELSADLLGVVEVADRDPMLRGLTAIAARLRDLIAAHEAQRAGIPARRRGSESRGQDPIRGIRVATDRRLPEAGAPDRAQHLHGAGGGEQTITAIRIWADEPRKFMNEVRNHI